MRPFVLGNIPDGQEPIPPPPPIPDAEYMGSGYRQYYDPAARTYLIIFTER
jgi:hypothetical protein